MADIKKGLAWFKKKKWKPYDFQIETWEAYLDGHSGLVNAPTGSGKTYSLFVPILLEYLQAKNKPKGLQAIWITPIRALAKEIKIAGERIAEDFGLDWDIAIRSGDTKPKDRQKQKRKPPHILITTPESLHLLLASKKYEDYFGNLKSVVVDEWHELIGSKRGVQMELALSRIRGFNPTLKVWGISATIGNLDEALEILLADLMDSGLVKVIKADIQKEILVETLLPDVIEKFPWAGHLGLSMLKKVLPVIYNSKSTLIFTNTRAQSEIWYQNLLALDPDLAGQIAMHHGSIGRELRDWVEDALHHENLKAVVCTSSLDLGVDFRPVDSIVQIGSPKGVSRFVQRAGRSGHQPGATSKIYFVPTHSLELVESAALRRAIKLNIVEDRIPYIRSFDVLVQYLVTLAVSDGFDPKVIYPEIKKTFSYSSVSEDEWAWCLSYITTGGDSLDAYDEYNKVIIENGIYKVTSKRIAMRHRLSIGTIVADGSLTIAFVSGKRIGTVEEWFIAQLRPGDTFWFAGRSLELVRIKGMTAQVKKSKKKKGKVPSWMGGRMQLSVQLADMLRYKMNQLSNADLEDVELQKIYPLIELQKERSAVPNDSQFLIEYFKSKEGYHLLVYPFEGRYVHEGMSALIAYRISQQQPISFSIAMNDYGFELLSDMPIDFEQVVNKDLFSPKNLMHDIEASINSAEMARRKFRDIASISGLIFKGFPGKHKKDRHLKSSSQLFFEVFTQYDPNNLLLLQAYDEVMNFQLEEARLMTALQRIQGQTMLKMTPDKATPFSFPIIVDRLQRIKLSSENIEDRIAKMKIELYKD